MSNFYCLPGRAGGSPIVLGGSAGQYSIVMAGLGPATHDLSAAQNGSPVGLVWFQPGEKVEMPFDAVAARGSRR
jgi:hypothetical protein